MTTTWCTCNGATYPAPAAFLCVQHGYEARNPTPEIAPRFGALEFAHGVASDALDAAREVAWQARRLDEEFRVSLKDLAKDAPEDMARQVETFRDEWEFRLAELAPLVASIETHAKALEQLGVEPGQFEDIVKKLVETAGGMKSLVEKPKKKRTPRGRKS